MKETESKLALMHAVSRANVSTAFLYYNIIVAIHVGHYMVECKINFYNYSSEHAVVAVTGWHTATSNLHSFQVTPMART